MHNSSQSIFDLLVDHTYTEILIVSKMDLDLFGHYDKITLVV